MINPFINEFTGMSTSVRKERIASLLSSIKLQKSDLILLANSLSTSISQPPQLQAHRANSRISSSEVSKNLGRAYNKIMQMYTLTNDLSTFLDSLVNILYSEVKFLDDELTSLEKEAQNFAFLLAEGGAFNYAFLESFNDELNRDTSGSLITDRNGLVFEIPRDLAYVDAAEGVLLIADNFAVTYPLQGKFIEANFQVDDYQKRSIKNIFSDHPIAWRVETYTSAPLRAGLDGDSLGAQIRFEASCPAPALASAIQIAPVALNPIEIRSVKIFTSVEDRIGLELLNIPVKISGSQVFSFPATTVERLEVLIAQPTYNRTPLLPAVGETSYQTFSQQMNQYQVDYAKSLNLSNNVRYQMGKLISGDLRTEFLGYHLNMLPELGSRLNYNLIFDRFLDSVWRSDSYTDFLPKLLSENLEFFKSVVYRELETYRANNLPPSETVNFAVNIADTSDYGYVLAIKQIQLGLTIPREKGVFISQPIYCSGDISDVRVLVSENHVDVVTLGLETVRVTSSEYCVANVTNPTENDWQPILPLGMDRIEGERLLPDVYGKAYLRFPAQRDKPFDLYRNGLRVSFDSVEDFMYDTSVNVIGIKLPRGVFSPQDYFTCNYSPIATASMVSFAQKRPVITPASDATGTGIGFAASADRNTVVLPSKPYVDTIRLANCVYLNDYGTIPYSPIQIILDDDTHAVNLTNYIGDQQTSLASKPDGYYFIHSNNMIMFNRAVTQGFRVFYDTIENILKFRVVLRSNSLELATPVVDFFQLKAKVRTEVQ